MRVFILKEGKEYNQGVAYLDDGTMVVVDNARKLIGKTADIAVTKSRLFIFVIPVDLVPKSYYLAVA